MNNPFVAIANYLNSRGIATIGQNLFLDHTPPSPDTLLVIRATGGIYDPTNILHAYDKFTMQLESRGVTHQAGYNLLVNAYDALQNVGGQIDGIWFVEIVALQPFPVFLQKDSLNRFQFVQNYRGEIYNPSENRI